MSIVRTDTCMHQKLWHLKFIACALVLVALTGCLYPHTSPRSPEISGSILDARSHAPVQGAEVSLSGHPQVSSTSDAVGHFRLRATRNFHLCVGQAVAAVAGGPQGIIGGRILQFGTLIISLAGSEGIPLIKGTFYSNPKSDESKRAAQPSGLSQ